MLTWKISGTRIGVECNQREIPILWQGLFPAYADGANRSAPDLSVIVEPVAGWSNPRELAPGESGWRTLPENDGLRLDGPDFTGAARRGTSGWEARLVADSDEPSSLAMAVRSILDHVLLVEHRTLLLHASGVVRGGRLFLFCAPARTGKTTIARELNGGGAAFSVDQVAVEVRDDGVRAHPTPFSDEAGEVPRLPPAPPAAIVFIEQGPGHELRPVSGPGAAARIVGRSFVTRRTPERAARVLELAAGIAARVPCYDLRFSRDPGFWALLDRVMAA